MKRITAFFFAKYTKERVKIMRPPINFIFLRQGKVRDVYAVDDDRHLLIVASDRISAFDHVLPDPIPGKGKILTRMSNFWFDRTNTIVRNHMIDTEPSLAARGDYNRWHREELIQRAVLIKKPIRCPSLFLLHPPKPRWERMMKISHLKKLRI